MSDATPEKTQKSPNRRSDQRLSPKRKIKLICRNCLDLGPNLALGLLDISETGLGLRLKSALEKGVEVTITLEGAILVKGISRSARVVWCYPTNNDAEFLVGVTFEKRLPYAEYALLAGI